MVELRETRWLFVQKRLGHFTDYYWAFFNQSSADARKARAAFIAKYGRDRWNKVIAPILKGGCMLIFNTPPTRLTWFYIESVARAADRGFHRRRGATRKVDCVLCNNPREVS